ncbi:5-formyltetrahydrofolate cyclo-ligase [Kitasatospora sp. NBC_00240]|uniref:5-formyltetrahydrofolate cyclo-ligase n=1 Tax=Kitasatospora sp. NBC_00240 TaxID=2903567 RepID=UPI0022579B64|nr:5-formyltetrahydrofolate cyclo-ligase [Kitasatospora sp. NBC_00240]MCX5211164.1 5-formyltetrahydrofolate cyclo-ligase [Kitasatospora sp. NBC_00240]
MHNEKAELRTRLLAERRAGSARSREAAAAALAGHAAGLAEPGQTVAAYVSVGAEPGTGPLLDALAERGVRVLLPVLLADNDLDWARYEGPDALAPATRGLLEPTGPRLGPDAVTAASVVLLPGLAVDRHGLRLGRGGGSYDRVLARLARAGAHPLLATLLYEGELLDSVPAEPHDLPVDAAVTPSGVHRLGPRGRAGGGGPKG